MTGGLGRPDGMNRGYFVKPTVFANVTRDMRIAREEIFGPVLSIMPYDTIDDAVSEANDTVYGLASYVQSKDLAKAREVARKMRSGCVYINYPAWDVGLPFGGYKQSGNGREYAEFGLEDFLESEGHRRLRGSVSGVMPAHAHWIRIRSVGSKLITVLPPTTGGFSVERLKVSSAIT